MSKVKTLSVLKKIVNNLKKKNKRIVFTNGCFDIIHPGHIKILKDSKSKGDILIVGLNSDSSIRRIKGTNRPVMDENARSKVLEAIGLVDFIVIFNEDTPYRIIKELRPDYLVKGEDWKENKIVGREFVKKIFRIKFYPGYSTTDIIQKIKNG
ncbi:MAG: adenylyltransferase/cytidyltransferase family protein [Candidatus Omnitrophica bacterium]|jgi:bifunctional ADP-heptose synthase (sugar kinase/adenylyltransferase)|nr:adenylyltransferase/cytidyltransferase family protein [Candidatus Omnitrophota bacterium]